MSAIENLIKLQDQDIQIRDIERELRDIPKRKQLEQDRLAAHEREVAAATERVKALQAALKELELEVDSRREKIAGLRRQQMQLKTNKEFKAMDSEIVSVERDIREIEDRELNRMSEMDELNRDLQARKSELAEEKAVVDRDVSAWDERAGELEREVERLRSHRAEAAQGVDDAEMMALYERVFERKDRALVPLEDGVCGGCHMKLPPYVYHEISKQLGMVTCDFCGRLLYKPQ